MPKSSSLWTDTIAHDARPPLAKDAIADVCVVGAGIAGLTTAYLLAREGKTVAVIDAVGVGAGQTSFTTAHLSNAIDAGYKEILRLHGIDGAKLVCQSHRAAIDRIETACRDERIDADFERVNGYLFLGAGQRERILDDELEAARAAGADVMRLPDAGATGFRSGPCLRYGDQAQFHPLKYLHGLADAIERRGGTIYSGTRATAARGGPGAKVVTASGHTIAAATIVIATNSPFNDLVAIHTKQAPYHTYVIGLRLDADAVTGALYWDTQDPYHYVRLHRTTNAALGGDNADPVDILIVGGEDHKAGQAQRRGSAIRAPRSVGARSLPRCRAGRVPMVRSGHGDRSTVLPSSAATRSTTDNVYIATGDSGMGMTHGTIAGILLTDLILGRENPWAKTVRPLAQERSGAAGEYVKENLNVAAQYEDWLTRRRRRVPSERDRAGQRRGRRRSGAQGGRLSRRARRRCTTVSAVCPHLGCIVAWNPAREDLGLPLPRLPLRRPGRGHQRPFVEGSRAI